MATMILLPDTDGINADWTIVGESTFHDALKTDDGNTSYVKSSTNLASFIVEFANPSVAEGNISSINSVRFLSSGKSVHRTDPSVARVIWEEPTGNSYTICSYDAHRTNYETINGSALSHANGTVGGWSYANLEDIELKVTKIATIELYLSYFAMEVTYTPAVTDNATFFGANF